jgi:carbamoylphosphate synthase large subunit
MLGFGGQTALNCGVSLYEQGILQKYSVRVLGTPIKGINITEDRQRFKEAMIKSDVPVLQSFAVNSLQEAFIAAIYIGRQGRWSCTQ